MPDEPSVERWRLDTPAGANAAAVERFDPSTLGECRVVITLSPRGGRATVLKDAVPVLTLEVPNGVAETLASKQLVHRLLRDLAAACDGEAFAV